MLEKPLLLSKNLFFGVEDTDILYKGDLGGEKKHDSKNHQDDYFVSLLGNSICFLTNCSSRLQIFNGPFKARNSNSNQ